MRLGRKGKRLIKSFEKCVLTAYLDGGGVWTIGWGHTSAAGLPVVKKGMRITQEEADEIFERDCAKFEKRVNSLVEVDLTQDEFDALVSFDFNTGALGKSTLLKKLNAGDSNAVPRELMKYVMDNGVKVRGLVRRRQAEADLWSGDHADDDDDDNEASFHNISMEDDGGEPDLDEGETEGRISPARTMVASRQGWGAIGVAGASGLGAISTAADYVDAASDGQDALETAISLLMKPQFTLAIAAVAIAVAIWFWRKSNMKKGVE